MSLLTTCPRCHKRSAVPENESIPEDHDCPKCGYSGESAEEAACRSLTWAMDKIMAAAARGPFLPPKEGIEKQ